MKRNKRIYHNSQLKIREMRVLDKSQFRTCKKENKTSTLQPLLLREWMHKCFSIMCIIKSEFHRQITLLVCPDIFCRGGGRKKKLDEKRSEKR